MFVYNIYVTMSTASFRFDLFDPAYKSLLSNCRYINLPFDIPDVYQEVNFLLTQCGEVFFLKTQNSDLSKMLKTCAENAKAVLHISWEKINTGHWKNVDQNWRYAYTLGSLFNVLCLLLDKNTSKFDIIKACDMGLLMGAPVMQNILSKIAFNVSAMLLDERNQELNFEKNPKKLKSDVETEELKYPLAADNIDSFQFKNIYIKNSTPIKFLSSICDWPALSSSFWSVDYILNKARFRTVPIEIGSKYTDDTWTQKLMTVEDFVDKYIVNKSKHKEIGYLAQHNLFDQIPELFNDIQIPSHITENYGNVDVDISVYFGPSGTISPLHFDPKHNLLAQVIGRKYIRLYSKEMTKYLYPRDTWLSNTSQVDVEKPDLDAHPLFKEAPYKECILGPGDLLYIPPGCWHYVRSLSVSLSISFWWEIPDDT